MLQIKTRLAKNQGLVLRLAPGANLTEIVKPLVNEGVLVIENWDPKTPRSGLVSVDKRDSKKCIAMLQKIQGVITVTPLNKDFVKIPETRAKVQKPRRSDLARLGPPRLQQDLD